MRHHPTRLVVATAALAITAPATAVAASTASGNRSEPTPSAVAVTALTTESAPVAADTIPADFRSVMGYRPVIRGGRLVDAAGGCSSPVPMPAEFSLACAEHDLGYDLLRYAALTGDEVGGWARQAIDDRLDERMRAACAERPPGADRAVCTAAASIASAGVGLNSVRQLQQEPEETVGSLLVSGLAGAAAVCAAAALLVRARGRRRAGRGPGPLGAGRGVPA